jgi:hypothetical protein
MPISPGVTRNFREMALYAAIESPYGTDAAPGVGTACIVSNVQIRPLQANKVVRNYIRPQLGLRPSNLVLTRTEISFDLEASGCGTPGTAPPHDIFFRAAGFGVTLRASTAAATIAAAAAAVATPTGTFTYTRTTPYAGTRARTATLTCTTGGPSGTARFTVSAPAIGNIPAYNQTNVLMTNATPFNLPGGAVITPNVGTSFVIGDAYTIALSPPEAVYRPISDRNTMEGATIYCVIDNERHKIVGLRGNISASFSNNGNPTFSFQGTGFFAVPDTVADLVPDISRWRDPLVVNSQNTPVAQLNTTVDLVLESFSFNAGNQVALKERVNRRAVRINDRAVTMSALFEAPAIADLSLFAKAFDRTTAGYMPFSFQHGLTAGDVIAIDIQRLQIDAPTIQESDSDDMRQMTGDCLPVAGDDEISIAFR